MTDSGSNDLLNFPEDLAYEEEAGNTTMTYSLDLDAGDYRVEFFSNSQADSSGNGEGETYLGASDITHSGAGNLQFTSVLSGTGYENITATVTEIDDASPNGYGSTSEFSDSAVVSLTVDLGIVGELNNPETLSVGNPASYTITVKNYGPDPIDISGFDNSNFGINTMASMALPPDLTYASVAGGLSCTSFGPNSSPFGGAAYANHQNYELVVCGYTGPSHILKAGDSISFTLNVLVDNGSDLEFSTLFSGPNSGYDPDQQISNSILTGGYDIIDYYENTSNYHPNNGMLAYYPLVDINTDKVLVDPPDSVEIGDTLTYRFTFTNDGTTAVDLTDFDGSGNPLLNQFVLDLLPPELEYDGVDDPNVACLSYGPGSATILNPAALNHSLYSLLGCSYTVPTVVAPGESVGFNVTTTVVADFDGQITNYIIGPGGVQLEDPDSAYVRRAFNQAFQASGNDIIDLLQTTQANDNFSLAAYTNGGGGTPEGNDSPVAVGSSVGGKLANTGEAPILAIMAAICLILSAASIDRLRRKTWYVR